jgi:signal transduction histidine kinase
LVIAQEGALMALFASRFTPSLAVQAIHSNWRRFWRWCCAVDTADPVRRTLNQGFAILIGCFIPIAIVQFLVFLVYRKSPFDIVLMLIVLLLLVGCWWWNRRGAVRGTIVFIALAMAAVAIFMPPSSYASIDEPVPLLFLVPIVVATLFVTPRAGVAAYLGMYATLILAVALSDVPPAVALHFALVVGIDLGIMTSILVLSALLFTRALRQAARSNAALQELNASLEQQVADRTAEIVAATAALARRDAARVRDISAVTHDLRNGLQRVQDALDMA